MVLHHMSSICWSILDIILLKLELESKVLGLIKRVHMLENEEKKIICGEDLFVNVGRQERYIDELIHYLKRSLSNC